MKQILLIFAAFFSGWQIHGQNIPAPQSLAVNYLRLPSEAVITGEVPTFSWDFPQTGLQQTAYRILVASSPYLLQSGQTDQWDSKRVDETTSVNVAYNGKPLHANSVYWWQVKVWSKDGLESAYSVPQQFNTGTFDRSDLDYPGQSRWVEMAEGQWVSEDKQCATFHYHEPLEVYTKGEDALFIAFEKSAIGILTFTATTLSETQSLTIHLGERKQEDLTVHKDPGHSNIGYQKVEMPLRQGTHHYVVKIKEREIKGYLHSQKLAPHYPEVMPFHYAEILGDFSEVQITDIQQGALFYFFDDRASSFNSSDERLDSVWDLCKYTLKATPFLGVYADGNRERMPYEADAYIQQLSHFVVDREYSISRYTINFLLDHASWPTEWQMHVVLMAWEYYMHTGDASLFAQRYDDLKRKTLIDLTDDNHLISTRTGKKTESFLRSLNFPGRVAQFRDIVDWPRGPAPGKEPAHNQSPLPGGETDGFVFNDYNAVVNAFHYRCLVLMSKIASVIGQQDESEMLAQQAARHKIAYLKTFFDSNRGIIKDGELTDHASLHANMFAMAFGLIPRENVSTVSEFIKSRGMACSVYGAQYLLEALYHAGESDYALQLMTSRDKRSWLNMIRVGSSMTTEAWDEYYKPNLTWNHAWGAAPANIIARELMGIEALAPAFEKFRICPQPGTLEAASLKLPTLHGVITVDLAQTEQGWTMQVSVPGNSEAELWLPKRFNNVRIHRHTLVPDRGEFFAGELRSVYKLSPGKMQIDIQ